MGIRAKLIDDQRERAQRANIPNWKRISAQLAAKVGPMALRGVFARLRLKSSAGIPLIGRGVRLRNPHLVAAGRNLIVEDFAEIQGLSIDGIRFGDDVSIGAGSLIRPSSYYSRDIGKGLVMGDGSSLSPGCYIGCSGGIRIGTKSMIGPGVRLFAENHAKDDPTLSVKEQGVEWGEIVIGDGCWLASGVTVTAGVTIGDGAVIAAGAVVTRDVPAGAVYGGIPARPLHSTQDVK